MAKAIGALRALFLCLDELLPENSPPVLIVLALKDLDYLRAKRWQRSIQQIILVQDFVSTGVRYKIRQLESRNVVRFGFDLELLAREYVVKSFLFHILSAFTPEPGKRLL